LILFVALWKSNRSNLANCDFFSNKGTFDNDIMDNPVSIVDKGMDTVITNYCGGAFSNSGAVTGDPVGYVSCHYVAYRVAVKA
jgi:hypothetical protein